MRPRALRTLHWMTDKTPNGRQRISFIRAACAHLSEEEQERAEDVFLEYLKLVLQIHERIWREKDAENTDHFDSSTSANYDT